MSHQAFSENIPPLPTDTVIDSTPVYSSFEHFEPGLKFLSNDPSSEDRQLALRRQQEKQQKQRELSKNTAPQDDDAFDLGAPSPEDSDFVDLLYIVDSAGHTTVMEITSPPPGPVPPLTPQPTSSEQYSLPAEHDVTTQTECLPPLSAAFNPPSTSTTTIIAGSDSARAIFKSPALKEEADERAREAKLMS